MKSIKIFITCVFAALIIFAACVFLVKIELPARRAIEASRSTSSMVRALARPILFWEYVDTLNSLRSDNAGWYPIYLREKTAIEKLELQDRIDIYFILIFNMDFSAESVYDFCAFAKPDAFAFASALRRYEGSSNYLSLSQGEKIEISRWREKFEDINRTGNI